MKDMVGPRRMQAFPWTNRPLVQDQRHLLFLLVNILLQSLLILNKSGNNMHILAISIKMRLLYPKDCFTLKKSHTL